MKIVIQRVLSASVSLNKQKISKIDRGLLILLGIEKNDTTKDIDYLINKIIDIRIFNDSKNTMNLSIKDINGELLVVSQFTLCADVKKGRRPSFFNAANPEIAEKIYINFCNLLKEKNLSVQTGKFGSTMEVSLINDGPVTIVLNSNDLK